MLDFGDTYEEELPRVYGYVAYQVMDPGEAEDLTQQTFERALVHWGEFDDRRATVTTWLLAIARNLIVDHYRARSRRPPTTAIEEVPEAQLQAPRDSDARLGISPELESALAGLGERERELIALRYGADLSGPQIAILTGLSVPNVQQILSRSLRRLRASLEGDSALRPLRRSPVARRLPSVRSRRGPEA